MIDVLLIFFTLLLVFSVVVLVPLALIGGLFFAIITDYQNATEKIDKIYALCSPLTLATPFIYYHFINDSFWQAALSLLIIPTLVEVIWGENGYQNATNKSDKIYVLCLPLTLATPFIYYHFINDSFWQAALSLLIISTLVAAIWGKNRYK